jgi:hypothetical protein
MGLKLLSCAIQEDGTYTVLILDEATNMSRVYDGCQFQELRFNHRGDNLELGVQVLGVLSAHGYKTIAGATVGDTYTLKEM